jgi:signal transduction histidine kinase
VVKSSWRTRIKTVLAIVWLLITFSIVAWWLVYSLQREDISESAHRMFAWEGSILLACVLLGGGTMAFLTYKDEQRQHRLQFFFSTFSHDIKTSIARLRLQADVLEEDAEQSKNPVFKRLLHDITAAGKLFTSFKS